MGKLATILLSAGLMFFLSLPVKASIINVSCNGGGAVAVSGSTFDATAGMLSMSATQMSGGLGYVSGDITTDATGEDPIIGVDEDVFNDTTFAWTDYHIAVCMSNTFSLSAIDEPNGWVTVVTSPSSNGTNWISTIDYYQGTGNTIAIGEDGTFGYKISYTGSSTTTHYCVTEYPTPEPATLLLLGLGAFAMRRRK